MTIRFAEKLAKDQKSSISGIITDSSRVSRIRGRIPIRSVLLLHVSTNFDARRRSSRTNPRSDSKIEKPPLSRATAVQRHSGNASYRRVLQKHCAASLWGAACRAEPGLGPLSRPLDAPWKDASQYNPDFFNSLYRSASANRSALSVFSQRNLARPKWP
jgi:hypothetical protein